MYFGDPLLDVWRLVFRISLDALSSGDTCLATSSTLASLPFTGAVATCWTWDGISRDATLTGVIEYSDKTHLLFLDKELDETVYAAHDLLRILHRGQLSLQLCILIDERCLLISEPSDHFSNIVVHIG